MKSRLAPRAAASWLRTIEARTALLSDFPSMAPIWFIGYRRLVIARELGLYYSLEGQRIFISGIYPLEMSPETIRARLQQDDWP